MSEAVGPVSRARLGPTGIVVCFWAALASCFGCERNEPVKLPKPDPYIALERDFQNYGEWPELDIGPIEQQGTTHEAGDARIWVNAMPPTGATEFPVGTTIVKQAVADGEGRRRTFAMVKRGGGYNAKGSPGWEWFELAQRADDSTALLWRGPDVRAGDSYRPGPEGHLDDPMGGCNGCHQMAQKNDFVLNEALRLSAR